MFTWFCTTIILATSLLLAKVTGSDHYIDFKNNCPFTVWMGALGNAGKPAPNNGGWEMQSGVTKRITVASGWAGRFWPRRDCESGRQPFCLAGDCGKGIECNGAGGIPPVTLAEITFNGHQNLDFYDISLVDGYNLPLSMEPIEGTFQKSGSGEYSCTKAGCVADVNAKCPSEMAIRNSAGHAIACKSACLAFGREEYCCSGAYNCATKAAHCPNGKQRCQPSQYSRIFKEACPKAYSYAYDDELSTFTCRGSPTSAYLITVCP